MDGGLGVWRIHIQLEIGHNEEVVPELAFEIGCFVRGVLDVGHNCHQSLCSEVAFPTILDGHHLIDHILDVSSILWKVEFFSLDVVVSFHSLFMRCFVDCGRVVKVVFLVVVGWSCFCSDECSFGFDRLCYFALLRAFPIYGMIAIFDTKIDYFLDFLSPLFTILVTYLHSVAGWPGGTAKKVPPW